MKKKIFEIDKKRYNYIIGTLKEIGNIVYGRYFIPNASCAEEALIITHEYCKDLGYEYDEIKCYGVTFPENMEIEVQKKFHSEIGFNGYIIYGENILEPSIKVQEVHDNHRLIFNELDICSNLR